MFRKKVIRKLLTFSSQYSTKVEIDTNVKQAIESNLYKPRKQPGSTRVKTAAIPADIQKAIKIILDDNNAKSLQEESVKLGNYLRSRLLPPEEDDINAKAAKVFNSVARRENAKIKKELTELEMEKHNKNIQSTVFNILKKNVYRWGNISYDKATCLQYLMTRAAPEYAVIVRVLDEIRKIYPDYKPRSFFDFGSGVGTGTWAVNTYWKGDIFEYFCVDSSSEMNDLSRLILCHGRENVEMPLKGYFQRQFLPASSDLKYNIVLSAYSLFEMSDMKSRLQTLQTLWNKTEDFLIIIEQGTNAGFQIVNEAREFVLNKSSSKKSNSQTGYAFAPCPNDIVCPRYLEQKSPCNFLMKYETLPYPSKCETLADLFSYIILKKGVRPADDPQWPRVVRAPIVRSGHTICRLCTAQGELKEVIFSKAKYDQITYRCARSCNWGDVLPVK